MKIQEFAASLKEDSPSALMRALHSLRGLTMIQLSECDTCAGWNPWMDSTQNPPGLVRNS